MDWERFMADPRRTRSRGRTAAASTTPDSGDGRPDGATRDGYSEAIRRGYSRRQVIRFGIAAAVVPTVLLEACGGGGSSTTTATAGAKARQMSLDQILGLDDKPVTFDAGELRTVEAVLERLIPSDGEGPGAKEAKVWRYIDHALAGAYAELRPLYTANLAALDKFSSSGGGKSFADQSPQRQEAILGEVQAGKAKGFTPSAEAFFLTVRQHSLEGMFGDPYHGGNAEFVGWNLIGFPGILDVNPAAYQKLGVKVPQAERSVAQFEGMFELDVDSEHVRGGKAMGMSAGEIFGTAVEGKGA